MHEKYYQYLVECKKKYQISDNEFFILTTIFSFQTLEVFFLSEKTGIDELDIQDLIVSSVKKLFLTTYLPEITVVQLQKQIEMLIEKRTLKDKLLSGLLNPYVHLEFKGNKIQFIDSMSGYMWNEKDIAELITYLSNEKEIGPPTPIVSATDLSEKSGEFFLVLDIETNLYGFRYTRNLREIQYKIREIENTKRKKMKVITHFYCKHIRHFFTYVGFYYEGKCVDLTNEKWFHLNEKDVEFITSDTFYPFIKNEYEKKQKEHEKFITPGGYVFWFKKKNGFCKMFWTQKNNWRPLKNRARHEDHEFEPLVVLKTKDLEPLVDYFHEIFKKNKQSKRQTYLLSEKEIELLKKCSIKDELEITETITKFEKNQFLRY